MSSPLNNIPPLQSSSSSSGDLGSGGGGVDSARSSAGAQQQGKHTPLDTPLALAQNQADSNDNNKQEQAAPAQPAQTAASSAPSSNSQRFPLCHETSEQREARHAAEYSRLEAFTHNNPPKHELVSRFGKVSEDLVGRRPKDFVVIIACSRCGMTAQQYLDFEAAKQQQRGAGVVVGGALRRGRGGADVLTDAAAATAPAPSSTTSTTSTQSACVATPNTTPCQACQQLFGFRACRDVEYRNDIIIAQQLNGSAALYYRMISQPALELGISFVPWPSKTVYQGLLGDLDAIAARAASANTSEPAVVFVGTLPKTFTEEQIRFLFILAGSSVRRVNFTNSYGKSDAGSAWVELVGGSAQADLTVHILHKAVLFDEDGFFFARSNHELQLLRALCDQRRFYENQRFQVRPHDVITVQRALSNEEFRQQLQQQEQQQHHQNHHATTVRESVYDPCCSGCSGIRERALHHVAAAPGSISALQTIDVYLRLAKGTGNNDDVYSAHCDRIPLHCDPGTLDKRDTENVAKSNNALRGAWLQFLAQGAPMHFCDVHGKSLPGGSEWAAWEREWAYLQGVLRRLRAEYRNQQQQQQYRPPPPYNVAFQQQPQNQQQQWHNYHHHQGQGGWYQQPQQNHFNNNNGNNMHQQPPAWNWPQHQQQALQHFQHPYPRQQQQQPRQQRQPHQQQQQNDPFAGNWGNFNGGGSY